MALASVMVLKSGQLSRPRKVYETPRTFKFESYVNFDLLVKVFSQIIETDRPGFIAGVLRFVEKPLSAQHTADTGHFPSINGERFCAPLDSRILCPHRLSEGVAGCDENTKSSDRQPCDDDHATRGNDCGEFQSVQR